MNIRINSLNNVSYRNGYYKDVTTIDAFSMINSATTGADFDVELENFICRVSCSPYNFFGQIKFQKQSYSIQIDSKSLVSSYNIPHLTNPIRYQVFRPIPH